MRHFLNNGGLNVVVRTHIIHDSEGLSTPRGRRARARYDVAADVVAEDVGTKSE